MTQEMNHGALMDDVYRFQRRIYDVTRKYYLLGRDRLIIDLDAKPGETVLEVACGTGRNLAKIYQCYPGVVLYGIDISQEMLTTARGKLGGKAVLAEGDACAFSPEDLFGVRTFDHIVLSYSLSMIPDWQEAIREALRHLKDGGTLHIVDFGDQNALPGWFKSMLRAWLRRFHVTPRDDLAEFMGEIVPEDATMSHRMMYNGYAVALDLRKAA